VQEYARLARAAVAEDGLSRPAIAICHSFPDCWARPPADSDEHAMSAPGCPCPHVGGDEVVYRVGRTMFETAGLPEHLVAHCNAMDEVGAARRIEGFGQQRARCLASLSQPRPGVGVPPRVD
jgi:hypothetical protein